MEKQLARIFCNTQTSAVIVRDEEGSEQRLDNQNGTTPSLHQISEAESDINIALT